MDLPINPFKRALKASQRQIGLWCSLSDHFAVEVVAGSGFDWLLLDTEHSANELPMVLTQLQAAAPYPTHPVVRVPCNDMVTIKRYLDIGAQSLLIPFVQNEEDGVFIGPADLHASLGYPGETANAKVLPIIDDAIRKIRRAGKAPGVLTSAEADARRWIECGALFVAVGADIGLLARESEKLAAKFKA